MTAKVWNFQRQHAPLFFLSPFFVIFAAFYLYPLGNSVLLAFFQTNGPYSKIFVGWDNFTYLWSDPLFWKAIRNTVTYAFFSLCFQLPLSLFLALLLNSTRLKGRHFFRLVFFSPHLTGQVFVAILFSVFFQPRYGLISAGIFKLLGPALAGKLGLSLNISWLETEYLVMPALIITSLWMYVGFNMIYFLAALQSVDRALLESAAIDGANRWQKFLHVELPAIKPVAIFVLLTSTIGAFQLFELPYVLLSTWTSIDGPNHAGLTIVMYLYQQGFLIGNLGYASAIGWTLVVILFIIAIIQLKATGALKT